MILIDESQKKGRRPGSGTYKVYKWKVIMYDKETKQLREGKFCSIAHINSTWNLKLNGDLTHRIQTRYRADMSMRNGENSFLKRWGHIHLTKINEPVPPVTQEELATKLVTDPSLEQFPKNPKTEKDTSFEQNDATCDAEPVQKLDEPTSHDI